MKNSTEHAGFQWSNICNMFFMLLLFLLVDEGINSENAISTSIGLASKVFL